MLQGTPINRKAIIDAIIAKKGNIAAAARHMGASRQCVAKHVSEDIELKQLVDECRQEAIQEKQDLVEEIDNELLYAYQDLVRDRDTSVVIFGMKTRHGWSEPERQSTKQPATIQAPSMDPKE